MYFLEVKKELNFLVVYLYILQRVTFAQAKLFHEGSLLHDEKFSRQHFAQRYFCIKSQFYDVIFSIQYFGTIIFCTEHLFACRPIKCFLASTESLKYKKLEAKISLQTLTKNRKSKI